MPVITNSDYRASKLLFNGHLETIVPGILRKAKPVPYERERFELRDGDFIDLDWLRKDSETLIILLHGLEGNSRRYYIQNLVWAMDNNNWDILSVNCRSCSEEMNRNFKLYHHGQTEDLKEVIEDNLIDKPYSNIILVGFSMGGSQLIKLLGENGNDLPMQIKGGVAISTPCNLGDSARALSKKSNHIYRKRFIEKLVRKLKIKAAQFPDLLDVDGIDDVKHFYELDKYTAQMNGFESAGKFYDYASANNYIAHIKKPVLLINAINDPMLPQSCFPFEKARDHKFFFFEATKRGGHCGFYKPGDKETWLERRIVSFIKAKILT